MRRVLTGAMLLVAAALLGGCGEDAGREGGGAGVDPPDVAEVKAVIHAFLEAGRSGDADTLVGLLREPPDTSHLGAPRPRKFDYEVRDAWLPDPDTAEVTAYLHDHEIEDLHNEFLLTFDLRRADGTWKITSTRARGFWDDDRDE